MKDIKSVISELQEFRNSNKTTLIKSGTQRINEWDQETAIEQSHLEKDVENYILSIRGQNYLFNISETIDERVSTSYEVDETVVNNDKIEHKTTYSIQPLYFQEQFEYSDFDDKYADIYEINHLTKEDNVPEHIKAFGEQLREANKNTSHAPIDNEFDVALYQDQKELKKRKPDVFNPFSLKAVDIENNTVFDMQLKCADFERIVDYYDSQEIGLFHKANFSSLDEINAMNEKGIKIKDVLEVNQLANSTGNPEGFLNKLDKYSNSEALEMYHMMKATPKVVEIFSKDLNEYSNSKPKDDMKNKRGRGNRPR